MSDETTLDRLPTSRLSARRFSPVLLTLVLLLSSACQPGVEEMSEDPTGEASPLAETVEEAPFESGVVVYHDVGAGQRALVLVHGWASTTAAWKKQLPGLGRLGRVLAVNLPGHGRSTVPENGAYSLDLFAEAIAAVMDHAGVASGVLVGHSNGTPVALRFVRRYPERSLGLVAVDGALLPMGTPEQTRQMLGPLKLDGYQEWVASMIDSMGGRGLAQEDLDAIKVMAASIDQATLFDSVVATADPTMWSDDALELPVLALLAEQPTWSESYRAQVEERLPNVDWVIWSDVSHYLMMQRPEDFEQTLGDWLEDKSLL